MDKNIRIWLDGRIYPWEKAKIHVLSHSLHYGTGVFEGIRFYKTSEGPAVFRLDEHLKRLFYSASCLAYKIPYNQKKLKNVICEIIKKNRLSSGYVRPIVFYGAEHLGLHPQGCRIHVAVAAWPWGAYLGTKPVKTMISSFIRIHPKSTRADAKICGHYVNSMLASIEAAQNGCDEAILLDYKGKVAEGPGENIFIVKKGRLLTPSSGNILKGITRDTVFRICQDLKIPCKEKRLSASELLSADEAFYTGTAAQVSAIGSINGKLMNDGKMGPLTKAIAGQYDRIVHGREKKYLKWLTPVS